MASCGNDPCRPIGKPASLCPAIKSLLYPHGLGRLVVNLYLYIYFMNTTLKFKNLAAAITGGSLAYEQESFLTVPLDNNLFLIKI